MKSLFEKLPVTMINHGQMDIVIPHIHDSNILINNSCYSDHIHFDMHTKRLCPNKINLDIETFKHIEQSWLEKVPSKEERLMDTLQRKTIESFGRHLWKLEESGISVFTHNEAFVSYYNEDPTDRTVRYQCQLEYYILEDDLYKHAFIDGIYKEGAVEEAIKHCKDIVRRNINKIFAKARRKIMKSEEEHWGM